MLPRIPKKGPRLQHANQASAILSTKNWIKGTSLKYLLCFKFLIGSEEFGSSRDLGLDFSHLLVGNDPRSRQDGGWSLKARHPGSDWARIRD